jgi:predicted  nucleic acid-binding Zn-ribbon protein
VGISEAVGGRCGRCNIVLRPQFYQDLKKGETIMVCESCGRILYYNPVQSVASMGGTRVNMSAGMGVDSDV